MNDAQGNGRNEAAVKSNAVKEKLRAFIQPAVGDQIIQDDDDIFECGFVNSMYAMELMLFMETEWKIVIEGDDVDLENFASIARMTRFIHSKTASGPAAQ